MAGYRRDRINDEMTKELATLIREIKDPRVSRYMVSVTQAEVTPDLKYAKVYYSAYPQRKGQKLDKKELAEGLKSANGFLRRRIAGTLNLRITPELTFIEDESIAYGAHISSLLHSVEDDIRRFDDRAAEEAQATETKPDADDFD